MRPRTICPALILAASRNDRVMGRIAILRVSMITRKGFSQAGAPLGNRDAAHLDGFEVAPDKIRANHIGRPKDKVRNKCLDLLNT